MRGKADKYPVEQYLGFNRTGLKRRLNLIPDTRLSLPYTAGRGNTEPPTVVTRTYTVVRDYGSHVHLTYISGSGVKR